MANRLVHESSLYLKQHAENPVDWYPWGEAALEAARASNKPLLVSIGYSACHWCHVMAHESFEDDYIAGLMNEHFINVKVDREERPDVDQVYMEAVQMLSQQGGWPLNVFCFPDGRPFFGGTYFPPKDRGHGIIPWPQLLLRIADTYRNQPEDLESNADAIVKNLIHSNQAIARDGAELGWQPVLLVQGAHDLCGQHDDTHGGFGGAPKFPPAMGLDFLMAMRSTKASEQANHLDTRIDTVVPFTLTAMASGGLYDQIGYGFARYSVDERWDIPHFEKMLYDNGLLLGAYLKGYLRYRLPRFRRIVEETAIWLDREMRAEAGPFYASLDADSEGEEGKFYVWTPAEVKEALAGFPGDEVEAFLAVYQITEKGNFEGGTSHPRVSAEAADSVDRFQPLREALYEVRARRVWPGKDEKHPVSWNSLAMTALVEAGFYLDRSEWLHWARRAADWFWDQTEGEIGRLATVYYPGGRQATGGFLADFAYFGEALLTLASKVDWVEPGLSAVYLERAEAVAKVIRERFKDPHQPGYYFSREGAGTPATRKKDWFDNAVPSGNSSLIHLFSQLHAITGKGEYREEVTALRAAYPVYAARLASGVSYALSGLTQDIMGIVTIKVKGAGTRLDALRDTLARKRWRKVFVLVSEAPDQPEGYQFCAGTQCMEPTSDLEAVLEML